MGTSVTQFIKCLTLFLAQVMISSCEIKPRLRLHAQSSAGSLLEMMYLPLPLSLPNVLSKIK